MSVFWALIPAAGSGSRMGTAVKKQFLPMKDGRELLFHTLDIFQRHDAVSGIVLPVSEEDIPFCQKRCAELGFTKVIQVCLLYTSLCYNNGVSGVIFERRSSWLTI